LMFDPTVSPDGKRVAFDRYLPHGIPDDDPPGTVVSVVEFEGNTVSIRVLFPEGVDSNAKTGYEMDMDMGPVWSPSGKRLGFLAERTGDDRNLFEIIVVDFAKDPVKPAVYRRSIPKGPFLRELALDRVRGKGIDELQEMFWRSARANTLRWVGEDRLTFEINLGDCWDAEGTVLEECLLWKRPEIVLDAPLKKFVPAPLLIATPTELPTVEPATEPDPTPSVESKP